VETPQTIPTLSLKGRNALITGAGSGIGAATAELFLQAGANVALLDIDSERLIRTRKRIEADGGDVLTASVDIASPGDVETAFAQISSAWPRLDVVIANAGINGVWAPLEKISAEEWNRTMQVNLTGAFLTLQNALPLLRKGGGSVVLISSINGTRVFSNSGATAYACSKAALVALAKMAALELARDRIRVNVICPGSVETAIDQSTQSRSLGTVRQPVIFPSGEVPLTGGKPASPNQVAEAALFLASDLSSHITGTEIFVDGAQSLLKG